MSLNRDQILSRKPKVQEVELSDSGETVFVRRLTRGEFEDMRERDPKDNNVGMWLASCLCDKDGVLYFDYKNAEDVKECATRFELAETAAITNAALGIKKKEDAAKKSEASPNTDLATG
jgi:hypothetical protein